ncbi:bifunctional DNA primase/polymerase [Curtobacterium sp. NPDC089991]|uniref:bifunctional DNA primase/polymerase n=1 Tax=Curtobacterium sp. NPDC089991 TaxID=3363969 RepID=UPI0037F37E62
MSPRLTPEQLPDDYGVTLATRSRWETERWHVFPVGRDKAPLVRWKTAATNDPTMVATWQARYPNSNSGIACGPSGLLVMDADTAGEFERFCAAHHQPVPETFTVETAKGRHWYFQYRGPVKNAVRIDGFELDVRADGGYVVAPGSVHASGVVYEPVDPDAPVADLPEWLSEALTQRATPRRTEVPQGNQVRRTIADLLADPPERGTGQTNEWLTKVAGHLAAKHRNNRESYDVALAEAVARVDPAYDDTKKIANSVWATDQANHPDEKPAKEQKEQPLAQVLRFLRDEYDFAATAESEVYAVPKNGPRRPLMMTDAGSPTLRARVTSALFHETGRAPSTATVDEALRIVHADAFLGTERQDLDLRVAQRGDRLVLDLAQPGSARCVIVTGDGWTVEEQPPAGVLFRTTRTTKPLPRPDSNGNLDALRALLGWSNEERRWTLTRGWLVAACLPDIPRPLLLFTGQPGSGKTTRARLVLSVIDPREELGSSFGKNEGDEQAMAAGRYLVGFDNISRVSDETSDRLCRFVTGEESVKRKLYTDVDQSVVTFRRTGAITAVTQPSLRADALERLIPVSCDRIDAGERRSETQLRADFERDHSAILGGLLDALTVALGNLPASRDRKADRVRMADFQDVLHAFDPATAETYAESTRNVMEEAAETDPFVAAVTEWLGDQKFPLTVVPETARQAAELRLPTNGRGDRPWWPNNPARFSALLQRNTEPLWALGFRVDRIRMGGGLRGLRFSRVGQSVPVTLDGADQ